MNCHIHQVTLIAGTASPEVERFKLTFLFGVDIFLRKVACFQYFMESFPNFLKYLIV